MRRPGPRFWEPYSSSRRGSQNLGDVPGGKSPTSSLVPGGTEFQAAMRAPKRVTLVPMTDPWSNGAGIYANMTGVY